MRRRAAERAMCLRDNDTCRKVATPPGAWQRPTARGCATQTHLNCRGWGGFSSAAHAGWVCAHRRRSRWEWIRGPGASAIGGALCAEGRHMRLLPASLAAAQLDPNHSPDWHTGAADSNAPPSLLVSGSPSLDVSRTGLGGLCGNKPAINTTEVVCSSV